MASNTKKPISSSKNKESLSWIGLMFNDWNPAILILLVPQDTWQDVRSSKPFFLWFNFFCDSDLRPSS